MNSKNYFTQRTNRWILVLILFLLTQLSLGLGPLNYSSPVQSPNLVKFVVIGDSGTGNEYQKKVAHQMLACHERSDYEFVIMVGDNIYPWGEPGDYYEKFDLPYAPLLQRGVKFFAALGNHDVKSGHWKRAINYPGFNMNGHRYYTLTRSNGLAQFFALDTTTLSGGRQDHDQLRWLERELAASSATWKLAYFHHPLYSSGKRHGSDVKMRAELEPLLIQGGVRVVFSGHDHIYERLAPQHGIYYFVTGSAGQLRRGDIDPHTGLTVKGNDQVRHFLYVEIDRNEMRFQAISQDGEVIDSGRIPAPTS